MKKRIIFVDDEPNINDGLKRTLRKFRREWDMDFVSSGCEALERLSGKPYDIIITDMRMPLMTGNELLEEVKTKYPSMVRIILSGHSDNESTMKSVSVAHQFLSKPCDVDTLNKTITKACGMGDILQDKDLVQLVNGLKSIPSVPRLYTEIVKELENNNSIKNIGAIISRDIGMSAKVLQLVNSAFFGLPKRITSPESATVYLGMETIKGLVLATGVFSEFKNIDLNGLSIDRIWNHSIIVADCAKKIARKDGNSNQMVEDSFLAGLLHDIGILVLSSNMPDKYKEVLIDIKKNGCTLWEAERKVFGTTHSEVGAYLVGLWGLPGHLVEAIAYHHYPKEDQLINFSPLLYVHVADLMEINLFHNNSKKDILNASLDKVLKAGFKKKLPLWKSICEEAYREKLN